MKKDKNIHIKKEIIGGITNLIVLFLALAVSVLSLTFAWFKENYDADTNAITVSSHYVTTLYFDSFQRYQLDADYNYTGQSGLGVEGTETQADKPYKVRFLLTIRVSDDSPVPLEILYGFQNVIIKKPFSEAFQLSSEQIQNNFKLYMLNSISGQPDNIVDDRTEVFILVIQYFGEIENVPFEFSGNEYIGAEFTFAINAWGGSVL